MSPIRVLLADDHVLVRAGIRSILQGLAGIQVVAEAGDGFEVVRLAGEHKPDLVLMDISMAGMNGLEATGRLIREFPRVRVIILSMHSGKEYVRHALSVGAAGYLLKDSDVGEFERAVRAVARGDVYLSPSVSKQVVDGYVQYTGREPLPLGELTPRQREVFQLVAEGHPLKEIAWMLNVSVKTVEAHRSQLMQRLDIHDVAGLVRHAIRVGVVAPD